jgi:thymidylate synthase
VNATATWLRCLEEVKHDGELTSPRGRLTSELIGRGVDYDMSTIPVVLSRKRKLSYAFMAAEAAWILSGDNRVATIAPYAEAIRKFSDDGVRFFGAYGPRVVDQLSGVVAALADDPQSRRAVMTTWRENPPPTLDVPCTVSLQFLIRARAGDGARLHVVSTMRSNDVWLGMPYDVFNFSMIALAVAIELRAPLARLGLGRLGLGTLHHRVGSLHLYGENFATADRVLADREDEWPAERWRVASQLGHHADEYESVDALVCELRDMADNPG